MNRSPLALIRFGSAKRLTQASQISGLQESVDPSDRYTPAG